jgi:hypothetical protein
MNKYHDKYLKYKNKYLILKSQLAGMRLFPDDSDEEEFEPRNLVFGSPSKFSTPTKNNSPTQANINFGSHDNHIDYKTNSNIVLSDVDIEIIDLIKSTYGDDWVLTGSLAVDLYLQELGLSELRTFKTNDVDILYAKDSKLCNIDERSFGNYIRVQDAPQRSVTFSNVINSFDVNCVKRLPKNNVINGIKVLSPTNLLSFYLDDPREKDAPKITGLHEIIKKINEGTNLLIL